MLIVATISFSSVTFAQIPDNPIPPVLAVNMLGKGMLFEPQAGNADLDFSAPYKPRYGQLLKDNGFKSARVRYQGSKNPMMIAIADGPPYDTADDALLDEMEWIIDDLLSKDLAVVITFYGLTEDNPGDLEKMVSWWGYVANRFKNKSHRLIFDLFVEPWGLVKNPDHHRIMDYYEAITTEIRKTNPERILIYFKIPPEDHDDNPYGPGTKYFMTSAYDPVPADAGIYYMWDFHVLKKDTRDNIRLIEQAWEYQDSVKQAVWSGAWSSTSSDFSLWIMEPMATNINRRFIDRGVSSAYLMMFDGHSSIYDAQNDHNGNGILDEWTYPGFEQLLSSGPDIWWNLLSNPGFEHDMANWRTSGGNFSVEVSKEDHYLGFQPGGNPVSLIQDVTFALQNNGSGKYNALCYVRSSGATDVKFILKGTAGGSPFSSESSTVTVNSGNDRLINEPLDVAGAGTVEKAELFIEVNGDAATIDKTGLTMFFYENPVLNITLWPGERINKDNYSARSNSIIDINVKLRKLIKQEVANNNSDIVAIANEIHNIRIPLEDRLRELISPDYAYTTDEVQYRTGGYNEGFENKQYSVQVEKYIEGKDSLSYELNNQLTEQQDLATKYFVLNDLDFRELYYDVYRDYPEFIKEDVPVDTTVTVNESTLAAWQDGAEYRWLDCDLLNNPILGATEQSFSPLVSGSYAVEITLDGFIMRSGCHEIENSSGLWDKHPVKTTKVYPNPFQDFVIIQPENEHLPFTVNLMDIQGKQIKTYDNLNPASARIELNAPNGVYLIEVCLKERKEIFKIVRQ